MKNIIKKIKPLYFVLNKIRNFRLEAVYADFNYLFCFLTKKPYFGRKYGASMVGQDEAKILKHLIKQILVLQNKEYKFLEIGSWAGSSASVIANAIKDSKLDGKLYCVDVWRGTGNGIKITKGKINGNTIFNLFKRNIKYSGVEKYILPIQMTSDEFAAKSKNNKFDFIYIDGDHRYAQVKKDITNYLELLEIGGIMCGDDMDFFLKDVDEEFARENAEKDLAVDLQNKAYHPGVTLAVNDILQNKVKLNHSIWSIRKTKDGWISYDGNFS